VTSGEIGYIRLCPFLNEVLGGIMVPVVHLNEFGTGFDDVLNLGVVCSSCDQMVWPRVSRCDV
jgi:hypothetical protein